MLGTVPWNMQQADWRSIIFWPVWHIVVQIGLGFASALFMVHLIACGTEFKVSIGRFWCSASRSYIISTLKEPVWILSPSTFSRQHHSAFFFHSLNLSVTLEELFLSHFDTNFAIIRPTVHVQRPFFGARSAKFLYLFHTHYTVADWQACGPELQMTITRSEVGFFSSFKLYWLWDCLHRRKVVSKACIG